MPHQVNIVKRQKRLRLNHLKIKIFKLNSWAEMMIRVQDKAIRNQAFLPLAILMGKIQSVMGHIKILWPSKATQKGSSRCIRMGLILNELQKLQQWIKLNPNMVKARAQSNLSSEIKKRSLELEEMQLTLRSQLRAWLN